MLQNLHWYSRNENITYPIDETATCRDDEGNGLPSNILVDLVLRWPSLYGNYAFLSSLSVTKSIVSFTIQAAEAIDSVGDFTPLAVFAMDKAKLEKDRQYELQAQTPGVGGFVVFGSGIRDKSYTGRFSSPLATRFTPRAALAYPRALVTGLRGEFANQAVDGIVRLKTKSPLAVGRETREINGIERDCIVFRLEEVGASGGLSVPKEAALLTGVKTESVFSKFAGPCKGRPESGTCGDPTPIEFINSVGPDCNGNITIEFQGCAEIIQVQDPQGVAVTCGMGLIDACLPAFLPTSEGYLPSERDPAIPDPYVSDSGSEEIPTSESSVNDPDLPYLDCFEDGIANDFVVKVGLWTIDEDDTDNYRQCRYQSLSGSYSLSGGPAYPSQYVYASNTGASRSVSVWEGHNTSTLDRICRANIKMRPGPDGVRHNAYVVVNYRPHATVTGQYVYYLAMIDYDAQELVLGRFNGTSIQRLHSTTVPGILLERWYEIQVRVDNAGSEIRLTASFRSLEDAVVNITIGPVAAANYLPGTGTFGLGTDRALSSFSYFYVGEF